AGPRRSRTNRLACCCLDRIVDHLRPELFELRHGLAGAPDVVQDDFWDEQAEQRSGLGHSMISVGVPKITTQDPRVDSQTVVGLSYMRPKPIEFGLECSQPIGFMAADVGDAAEMAGVIGESSDRCHHRRQLCRRTQIKINCVYLISALNAQAA